MRRYVWIVPACFLLVAGALGAGAIAARPGDEPHYRGLTGITGQRQPIDFDVDARGRAQRFAASLYLQCSNGLEWRNTWTPSDGLPVEFDWRGDRLRVVERDARRYRGAAAAPATSR